MSIKIFTDLYIETCPICLELLGKQNKTHTLKCNHKFHKKCIFRYFEGVDLEKHKYYNKYTNVPIDGVCPICRRQQYDIIYGKNTSGCSIL